ncbi:hypothetical protein OOK13_29835 [Streptomyces sp. NBC_00378]|nr:MULTISPECIES: hypothetical protein [unclassified Streptomyces]MCX5112594.1 hypothetical protein [Streptomyces sp. NBC_00378]
MSTRSSTARRTWSAVTSATSPVGPSGSAAFLLIRATYVAS